MVRSISVAMATYNGQKYIKNQLDSILAQSYPIAEIVVLDDCSSDNTYKLLCEYSEANPQIKVMQNEVNIGVLKTFEKVLMSCSGDFIAVSDQDDVWLPNKIAELVLQSDNNYLVYSDAVVVDDKLNVINKSNLSFFETARSFDRLEDYFFGNNVTGCTMLVSKELVSISNPFPDFKIMYHDQYLAIIAAYFGKIKRVKEPLILYRQHTNNVSASFNRSRYELIISNSDKMASDLNKLTHISLFKNDINISKSLDIAINFFLAMAHKRYPRPKVFLYCWNQFDTRMFFWFIRMACLGKWLAYLNYNLAPIKDKIKFFLERRHSCK